MIIQFLLIFTFIDVVHVVFNCLEQLESSLPCRPSFRKRAKSAAEVIAGYVYSRFVTKFPLLCVAWQHSHTPCTLVATLRAMTSIYC